MDQKKKKMLFVHQLMSCFNLLRCNYNWPDFSYTHPPCFTDTVSHISVSQACFWHVKCESGAKRSDRESCTMVYNANRHISVIASCSIMNARWTRGPLYSSRSNESGHLHVGQEVHQGSMQAQSPDVLPSHLWPHQHWSRQSHVPVVFSGDRQRIRDQGMEICSCFIQIDRTECIQRKEECLYFCQHYIPLHFITFPVEPLSTCFNGQTLSFCLKKEKKKNFQ